MPAFGRKVSSIRVLFSAGTDMIQVLANPIAVTLAATLGILSTSAINNAWGLALYVIPYTTEMTRVYVELRAESNLFNLSTN